MLCKMCSEDIGELIVLLPLKQENGNLDTMACLDCAVGSGAYCTKHERPHLGFDDETTACRVCIEETVQENLYRVNFLVVTVVHTIGDREYLELVEAALMSSFVTGDKEAISVLRFLTTKAARMRVSLESILELIRTTGSISHLLG